MSFEKGKEMDQRSLIMLKVLLNRYHPKDQDALVKLLPLAEQQAILAHKIQTNDLSALLKQPKDVLETMDATWIQPILEKFPENWFPFLLATLPPSQAERLKKTSLPTLSLTPPVKEWMLKQICQHLPLDGHLPLELLPETSLSPLAKWPKARLLALADFLGIHDLASDIRQIVNTAQLKQIYACLTPKQLAYLKVCMRQKEKITSPKLEMDLTHPDCKKLQSLIHRRGLARLSKALSGQHPDLVWSIAYLMDKPRGEALLKSYELKAIPNVTSILTLQVTNLMNLLTQGNL